MKKYASIIAIVVLTMVFAGCAKTGGDDPQPVIVNPISIINEHYATYTNSLDISNVTLSSMFKYYLEFERDNNEYAWDSIENNMNSYVHQTTNEYINANYPQKANVNEALFLNSLAVDTLEYVIDNEIGPSGFQGVFEYIATELIVRMNNYAYDKDRIK